jgi:hypothetical protein
MSGEVSYFSRFFVKFVEIIAAGLASAISAYLLAHFVSSPTPASPPTVTAVQVAPNANGVAAQPAPPAAAAAASEHPAPQDSPEAKLVPKTGRDAKVLPPRKHTKTDTSVAGKEPRNQKSAEEQVRAALANVDANRRVPADPAIGPDLTDTRSVPADDVPPRQASVPSQQPGVLPRSVDVPPRRASEPAPNAANVLLQPVQPPPAPGADLRPRSPDIRTTSPSVSPVAPQPTPSADQDKDALSALKRIPDLLRPDPSGAAGEPPRPPMPVDTASPE